MIRLVVKLSFLAFFISLNLPLHSIAAAPTLALTESGSGIDHVVSVESKGLFRIAFEAAMNYGLSAWYDLVNDPAATLDVAHNPTDYNPAVEQGALFNQVIQKGDLLGSVNFAKLLFSGTKRSISILENSPARVVLETMYSPMFTTVNTNIVFTDRYTIYPDGRLYITHKLHSVTDQSVGEWRNSVIGLGDQSYGVSSDSGRFVADNQSRTLTDLSKNWMPGQWTGYTAVLGYNGWSITGNTNNTLQIGSHISGGGPITLADGDYSIRSRPDIFGWIRATDAQNPYQWSNGVAKYLFQYWDSATPAPNTAWTKASLLVVPRAGNPLQGKQSVHGWKGFKRFYYAYPSLTLSAGQDVVQQYMIQLGSKGSGILPDIVSSTVANPYAADYLNHSTVTVTKGSIVGDGFDYADGAYTLTADVNQATFSIDGTGTRRIRPVFRINDYRSDMVPEISVNGQLLAFGKDFMATRADSSTLIVQLQSVLAANALIEVKEGSVVFPHNGPDTLPPAIPAALNASTISSSEINLTWQPASDDRGVAGYQIYRNGIQIAYQSGTSFTDTGLTAGTAYSYSVSAVDEAGNVSLQSAPVSAATGIPVRYGILDYNTNTSDTVLGWIKDRFAFKISGRNPTSSGVHWDTYLDIYGPGSIGQLLRLKDWATLNRLNSEEILLHAKRDYTSAVAAAWSQLDKFDAFEGANGVLRTSNDVTYTDLTSSAYSSKVTWQGTVYVGYEEPFDQINMVVSTPGAGIARTWEFWNGSSWVGLPVTDGTASFSATGKVSFTPPSGWKRRQMNGSRSKYFVRCRLTSATTFPVTSSVRGDNWLRGAGNLCRGWDDTSSTIVNTGELAYNPTPPTTASAKFRYQSRISYWAANHFVANPADSQIVAGSPARSWAKFVASEIDKTVAASGYTGVMCDDGERDVKSDGIPAVATDFADKSGNSWATESTNKYRDIVSYVHALNPSIQVGINAQGKDIAKAGDWNLAEYHTFNWKTSSPTGITASSAATVLSYDDYLSSNNPTGRVGVMIYQDTADVVPGKTAAWDRGNRGPLVALSKHYIAMNDFTVFSYYTQGGYIYSDTDQLYLKDGTVLHHASDPIPNFDLVRRWGTYFPAMGVDIGIPDPNGYNAGVRNLSWKSKAEIGGIQDVWRRDFTKAIVLHRPASWNTTDSEYTTYSSAMALGGTYYPLNADGTTGSAVTEIALRAGEGAILMKAPLTR